MAFRFMKRDVLLYRNLNTCEIKNWIKINRCTYSTLPDSNVSEGESIYPPVKPKFPAGRWKTIKRESAWDLHELTHKTLEIATAKERLEFQAGNEARTLWLVEALSPRPNNTEFQKIITRTNLLTGEPDVVKNIVCENLLDKSCLMAEKLKSEEFESVIHGVNKLGSDEDVGKANKHNFVGNLLRSMVPLLASDKKCLAQSEIDENVRVESFWRVIGFEGDEKSCDGAWELVKRPEEDKDAGVLQFQYRHNADFQLRTKDPLPEFLPMNHDHCYAKEVVLPQYAPETVSIKPIKDRPINVSGHWIGSPCEFTTGSIHVMPSKFVEEYEEFGMNYLEDAEVHTAMTTMFGSCVAQAQDQGFCDVLDMTYPITTQCIIMNKHNIRFGYYQLNTLQLWNDENPLQNLMWISEPVKLSSKDENGKESIGKDFMTRFLKFLLLEPTDRGINLRPYLPDEKAPSTRPLMNTVGEEPFVHPVIGRWQYPRYSLYF